MSEKERGSCPLKRRKTDPKFRNRLRVTRAELEISQGELAVRAGTSRQTICAIEKGNFNPTAPLAMKLCKALGKTFEELFYMED